MHMIAVMERVEESCVRDLPAVDIYSMCHLWGRAYCCLLPARLAGQAYLQFGDRELRHLLQAGSCARSTLGFYLSPQSDAVR